jgi:hypothetical protein
LAVAPPAPVSDLGVIHICRPGAILQEHVEQLCAELREWIEVVRGWVTKPHGACLLLRKVRLHHARLSSGLLSLRLS